MADEAPVSQVLCEASEYLSKLGSNLRLRSQNLKEKRISKEKLRNAHAVQKAANKMLLICGLSKKSLENVENGIRKVLSIVSSSQSLAAIGGKPEKSKEPDRSSYYFFEYDSFKLRVSKKVPIRHYMSVKVLASKMPEAMIRKYPVYHKCKLYKTRKAERKSLENKEILDTREKDNNQHRSKSVDKLVKGTKTSVETKESNKDTHSLLSDTNDEEGFKGFSPIRKNTDQDLSIPNEVTKSRSPSPNKSQTDTNVGNVSENSEIQYNKNSHTKPKKFRRIQLIDDDVSDSSKEDLIAFNTAIENKSKDENCADTNLDHEHSNKRNIQKHSSGNSGNDDTSNHESNKLPEDGDLKSQSDCTDSGVSESKLKGGDDTLNRSSVGLNDKPSLDKDDEASNASSYNESNKPLLKCVNISKLLRPDIATKHSPFKDKKLSSRDKTIASEKSKFKSDHKTIDETECEYWEKKRAEVRKFKSKEFSINISRLPQFTDLFLNIHNLKRITKNNSIMFEIYEVASPSIDKSKKKNSLFDLAGSEGADTVDCTNLKEAKNSLLNDSDSDNLDSNELSNKTNNSNSVKQSLLAESDSEEGNKKNGQSKKTKGNQDEGEITGQIKELTSNKDDHHNEIKGNIPTERHDKEDLETETTSKLLEDIPTTDCPEKLPDNDPKAPNGKRKSVTESLNAKKMLLSSDSEVEDNLKSKIDEIKNSLLQNVSSSEDEKRKGKPDDDSPRKKLLASSGTDDEEENKRTKQKKKLKSRKKRKAYDSDKDSSSIEQMDGSVDSKKAK